MVSENMSEEKEFSAEEESTLIIDEPSLEDELIPTESLIDSMIDTSIADIEDEKDISARALSDEKLKDILKQKGYNIARRTVAKYREQLNIPVARLRKEL